MDDDGQLVEKISELYKGEMAAVETYRKALKTVENNPEATIMLELQTEHKKAAEYFGLQIIRYGGILPASSGLWGSVANALEKIAAGMGTKPAILALKKGEELGFSIYEKAAEDDSLPEDVREQIRVGPLLNQNRHVRALEGVISIL